MPVIVLPCGSPSLLTPDSHKLVLAASRLGSLAILLLLMCTACTDADQSAPAPADAILPDKSSTETPTTAPVAASSATEIDAASGLAIAPHWELARAHCGACHSFRLVTAQRGDKAYWSKTIEWMQRTQNLWDIPEPGLSDLINYLASNYNETEWGRRPPLSPSLLPGE